MKTNSSLSLGLLLASSIPQIAFGGEKNVLPPPNIVWLTSEDNSPFIGVYGDKIAKTPNIDQLAQTGIVYNHAFANAPVSAPARNTLITGMFPNSNGNHNMRSNYKLPDFVKLFPEYLRAAGYYTSNNFKEDYNNITKRSHLAWDDSSDKASYKNRKPNQPFFYVQNFGVTHETSLFDSVPDELLGFKPDDMKVFPYHPNTAIFRHKYAQYYYRMENLDKQIGLFVDNLKKEGLFENTIIFYFSDHGGVLPRSKRFLFESGTWVPVVVHVPEKYQYLFPEKRGEHSDRIVSFVDFAPSVLALAGIKKPDFMQGQAFVGEKVSKSKEYAFSFRGRMDEKTDLMHSARDKQYRYIRNYYPERIYGQFLDYLWRNKAAGEWEQLYKDGKLNDVQSAFWRTKPYEELYDVVKDPHNVTNLATNVQYANVLARMSKATDKWIDETRPVDVVPEAMLLEIDKKTSIYDSIKGANFPLMLVHKIARMSAKASRSDFKALYAYTKNENPAIAFWGIKAMFQYKDELKTDGLLNDFKKNLNHPQLFIQILTAHILVSFGEKIDFKELILKGINSNVSLNRGEAMLLYMNFEKDTDIDKRIKERYEIENVNGPGDEQNIYHKLYEKPKILKLDK